MGKVPALQHGDAVVTETSAICAYLADAFPQAGLAPPPGDRLRAPYYRWLFFVAGPMEASVTNKTFGFVVTPERERSIGYGTYDLVMKTLDEALSADDYLVGGKFSAADLYVGAQVNFGLMFGTIEQRPAFVRYVERLAARPAFKRATDLDNALIPPQKAAS
jgi:glutathione S-transferase